MKEIIITINEETGDSTVEAKGFVGKSCTDATKPFIEAIGGTSKRTVKPEFNRVEASKQQKAKA